MPSSWSWPPVECTSRLQVALAVCEQFAFHNAFGSPRTASCEVALVALQASGHVILPTRQTGCGARCRPRSLDEAVALPVEVAARVDRVAGLYLCRVNNDPRRRIWNELMAHEHPMGCVFQAGAQIQYLIGSDHGWLGGLGFSGSAYALKARDAWIGWDSEHPPRHRVVNLSRFLIRAGVDCQNLASWALGRTRRRFHATLWLSPGAGRDLCRSGTAYESFAVGSGLDPGRPDRWPGAFFPAWRVGAETGDLVSSAGLELVECAGCPVSRCLVSDGSGRGCGDNGGLLPDDRTACGIGADGREPAVAAYATDPATDCRATDLDREGLGDAEIVWWHDQRADDSENRLKELRSDFSGADLPCSTFRANAVCLYLNVIACNLPVLLCMTLGLEWHGNRAGTFRTRLHDMAGLIVRHSREWVLKVNPVDRKLLDETLRMIRTCRLF